MPACLPVWASEDAVKMGAAAPLAAAMAFAGDAPAVGTPLLVAGSGKQVGKVVSCRGGVGLAMVRIQQAMEAGGGLGDVTIGEHKGALVLPSWWDTVVEAEKKGEEEKGAEAAAE
ncbi:hypothetical protein T484DRAFT_1847418 [Baffinella frigidus]|nr:hypothetical protein T484DRAFT_1847418 [Cryptophyta sp. CCMP2293]